MIKLVGVEVWPKLNTLKKAVLYALGFQIRVKHTKFQKLGQGPTIVHGA